MNKRQSGTYYENLVCDYLEENGAKIIERNFRCRSGEIDIILNDDKYLVFAEVKFRSGDRFGTAEEAVDIKKQKTISRVSDYYRRKHKISEYSPQRFDVVAVCIDDEGYVNIRWHKNAFSYVQGKRSFG